MAIKAETNFSDLSGISVIARVVKAAQNDVIVLPYPGVIPLAAVLPTGGAETTTYPTLTVNNSGDAYDGDSATIAYDGATASTRPSGGYYVLTASGEILFVTADSGYDGAAGNLTVRRGCLGTTASGTGLADGNTLYVLCGLTLASATTGPVTVVYKALPEDPGVGLF